MVCLGLEDGRRRRIHWAMAAPLQCNVQYHFLFTSGCKFFSLYLLVHPNIYLCTSISICTYLYLYIYTYLYIYIYICTNVSVSRFHSGTDPSITILINFYPLEVLTGFKKLATVVAGSFVYQSVEGHEPLENLTQAQINKPSFHQWPM